VVRGLPKLRFGALLTMMGNMGFVKLQKVKLPDNCHNGMYRL
jgi:hypothetical protein